MYEMNETQNENIMAFALVSFLSVKKPPRHSNQAILIDFSGFGRR